MKKNTAQFPGSMTLLILALLENGDKYGYEMIRELELRSDKTFSMNEGTLYPILHKLQNIGEIRAYEKESASGRKRKYYQLTKQGIHTLERKRREWKLWHAKAGKIIGGGTCATI